MVCCAVVWSCCVVMWCGRIAWSCGVVVLRGHVAWSSGVVWYVVYVSVCCDKEIYVCTSAKHN